MATQLRGVREGFQPHGRVATLGGNVRIHRGLKRLLPGLACIVFAASVPCGTAFQGPKPGDTKTNPKDGLPYVWLPPGKVTTGCSPGDKECYDDEYPTRDVTLTRGFWLGRTEVTQAAYEKVTGDNP